MQTLISPLRRETSPSAAKELTTNVSACLAATVVVALAAHVSISVPFTPVPFTLQPLAVLGVGLVLGPTLGFISMLAYLAEGIAGFPVFSPVGLGGIAQILGPTGGFLMAYPFVAFIVGYLTTRSFARRRNRFVAAFIACCVATLFLFVSGAGWLHACTGLPLRATLIAAVLPFIPGELIKVAIAAGVYNAVKLPSRN
jgi:biotin transport system substrate-specific component